MHAKEMHGVLMHPVCVGCASFGIISHVQFKCAAAAALILLCACSTRCFGR